MDRKKVEVINMLKKFLQFANKTTQIERAIFFGSRAKDNAKECSDVDIIIISKDFENKKSYKRSPRFYFMWDLQYDCDIICLTPKEFEKKKKQIGIIRTASEEGIEIL